MRSFLIFLSASLASAACLPIEEAPKHIGQTACIRGKVVNVSQTEGGNHFLNFCQDWRNCPFSAVVLSKDVRQVGDVRTLEGKDIEVHGQIRLYQGRPEVRVRDSRQLKGEARKLPPMPKGYDVTQRGKASPGQRPRHHEKHKKWKRPRRGADTVPETEPEPASGR